MATVGNIKAELLLKIEGTEGTVSVGHLEIPVNVTTDEKRPLHANVRADTSGVARDLVRAVDGMSGTLGDAGPAAIRSSNNRLTKEN